MPLSPALQALNDRLRDENEARVERLRGRGATAVAEPEPAASGPANGAFRPPQPFERHVPEGPFFVRYQFVADEGRLTYTHGSATAHDLVSFMAWMFRGSVGVEVLAVWEA